MDRSTVQAQARDALEKLYQEPLLRIHPLAGALLPSTPVANRGAALRQILLDAMQYLRPPHTTTYNDPSWRRYRSLFQHYLEGKSFEEIALEHGVSERQARRDHHQALEMLTDVLWARYCEVRSTSTPSSKESEASPDALSPETEIQRIGSLPPGQPLSLQDVLCGVIPVIEKLAGKLRTRLDLAIADALPPITVNQTAVRQALMSLLGCLVEAAPGGHLTVTAAAVPTGVEMCLRVRSRRGVSKNMVIDDRTRLDLSRRLLVMQGGQLDVECHGEGDISIRLVLPTGSVPTILIIDDNPDVLRLFQRYLQSASVRLIQATNAEQALCFLQEIRPRLIILDLMMPARDGWDLLQTLKKDRATHQIPIAVCSVVHERSLALALGASYFLPKPISRDALLEVLAHCGLGTLDRFDACTEAPH